MKFVFILLCLAIIAIEGRKKSEFQKWREECAEDNNIDLTAPKPKVGDKSYNSNDFKCYRTCLATKRGFLDSSGEPDYAVIKDHYRINDTIVANIKNCTSTGADFCARYFEIEKCALNLVNDAKRARKGKRQ